MWLDKYVCSPFKQKLANVLLNYSKLFRKKNRRIFDLLFCFSHRIKNSFQTHKLFSCEQTVQHSLRVSYECYRWDLSIKNPKKHARQCFDQFLPLVIRSFCQEISSSEKLKKVSFDQDSRQITFTCDPWKDYRKKIEHNHEINRRRSTLIYEKERKNGELFFIIFHFFLALSLSLSPSVSLFVYWLTEVLLFFFFLFTCDNLFPLFSSPERNQLYRLNRSMHLQQFSFLIFIWSIRCASTIDQTTDKNWFEPKA